MLDPEYFEGKEDKILEYYRDLEDFMIADISMRFLKAGEMSGTADRRIWLLKQMGISQNRIINKIQKVSQFSKRELKVLLQDAVLTSWADDISKYNPKDWGIDEPLKNERFKMALDIAWNRTNGELTNLTNTTANKMPEDYIKMLDNAEMAISTGVKGYNEAICDVLDHYAGEGVTIEYPSGRKMSLEAAVRTAVLTAMNQAAAVASNFYIIESGAEYVYVSQHWGARIRGKGQPYCAGHMDWQGKIYKIHGEEPGYPNLEEMTGYRIDMELGAGITVNPLGLHGYNCRHTHQAWFKGWETPQQKDARLKVDKKKSEQIYIDSQKQRAMERGIRKTKRQLMEKKRQLKGIAEKDVLDILQQDYDKLAYKLRRQNKKYNDFIEEKNLSKGYLYLKVSGFGKGQSAIANGAATRYENMLKKKGEEQ